MTWGSDCHQCGRADCEWVCGKYCDGGTRRLLPEPDLRLRWSHVDFDLPGFFFYVERREIRKGWFRITERWREFNGIGTRASTPEKAVAAVRTYMSAYYRKAA